MTAPNFPRARERLVRQAANMVNDRQFVTINGAKPFGVRGELYDALTTMRDLVHEVRDMQIELDRRPTDAD